MATMTTDPKSGCRVLQFVHPMDKKRKTLRPGRMNNRDAETFRRRIESLVSNKLAGTAPDGETSKWLATLDARIHTQLAGWDIVAPRLDIVCPMLMDFVDDYLMSRTDVKPRTKLNHNQARGFLAAYFTEPKRLLDVTTLDGKQFRAWMVSEGHAENYIRTQCKNIKMFFGAAVDAKLIEDNPFKGLPCKVQAVPSRMRYIKSNDVEAILRQTNDLEWRLVISLARWGGLRIPSEIAELKLSHVDWLAKRITIPQPKLAHIPGLESRVIPLFPEIEGILREARDSAPAGAVYLLNRLRSDSKNLRTTFNKLVVRAGLTPWTKPFGNMRSTRATELAEVFPLKTVAEWMGHDVQVSLENYQQVREEHWTAAIENRTPVAAEENRAVKSAVATA